jgi:hypothetical protein
MLAATMTILEHIVWGLVQHMITYIQHSFHTEGLKLWCTKPHRVFDPDHPSRLLQFRCFVNGITGMAHPAGR